MNDFRHRFTDGAALANLLVGVGVVLGEFGSLNECFLQGYSDEDETTLPALTAFREEISMRCPNECDFLLPDPRRKSACKRLNLFLRWMVRDDMVDPGTWYGVSASKLVIPLDTHMFGVGRSLGMTARQSAGLAAALEITGRFRAIVPEDPVRYDFALTRLGILGAGSVEKDLLEIDKWQ